MLQLTQVSKHFGARKVLDDVSLIVQGRDRIGLVGVNGSGKSTLLKIMAGIIPPDDGIVSLGRGEAAGYLPQDGLEADGRELLEEVLSACEDVRACESEIRDLEGKLEGTAPDDPLHASLLDRYGHLQGEFQRMGGYDLEARAMAILTGLGFAPADRARDTRTYSGGWQMRIALAKLLLRRPALLLLDEPTNHLDLEARNWLEEFLADYPGSVILVSHDRYFMDVTVDRILEISRGKASLYHTNYTRFEVEREERIRLAREAYEKQREEIARIEAFISRFRYQASKAALVQSRVKFLEKLERLEPPEGRRRIHFRFPQPVRSGRTVLKLEGAAKSYGEIAVYRGIDFQLERGLKAALVGPNGAGKSTLLKMLAGVEPLSRGTRKVGHNVTLDYFAQDQSRVLDEDKTVLQTLESVAPLEMVPHLRTILGSFLFSGDDVNKRVRVLSGGEKNRLALGKMLLRPANVLLLDEPTNHLDLDAKDVLLDALLQFEGTVLFVSHDRHFLDRLAQHVFEVGGGEIHHYPGNYEDYVARKARLDATPARAQSPASAGARSPARTAPVAPRKSDGAGNGDSKQERQREREARKTQSRETAKREKELKKLEERITQAEARLAEIEAFLANPDLYGDRARFEATLTEYQTLKAERDRLYDRYAWMERESP
jgi:ATP-binding cassette subfamily F protein 3